LIAYPELQKRGLAATSYVNTGVKMNNWSFSGEIAKEMVLYGDWDIQCHSHTHPRLTELTEEEIREQMESVNQTLSDAGLAPPEHHAYPFGEYNQTVKSIIREYRKTQRHTGLTGILTYDAVVPDALPAVKADLATVEDLERVKQAIDQAYEKNGIVITYSHFIIKGDITGNEQSKYDLFIEMVEYSINKGMKIITIKQLWNILNFYRCL